jgi:hypothetical protein
LQALWIDRPLASSKQCLKYIARQPRTAAVVPAILPATNEEGSLGSEDQAEDLDDYEALVLLHEAAACSDKSHEDSDTSDDEGDPDVQILNVI